MNSTMANNNLLYPGSLLKSGNATFQVQSILGEGAFGKVFKCVPVGGSTPVAIKVMKPRKFYKRKAQKEMNNLVRLLDLDHDKCAISRVYGAFKDQGHYCMVFELLDKSLSDYMRQQCLFDLPLVAIKLIVCQLAKAFEALHGVGLAHMDLKLDNIMLVNHRVHPFLVKLIDFGLATKMSSVAPGTKVQTLTYRAPEVMLGLPLTEAIDIWSQGVLAARLYLGSQLYEGVTEDEMMKRIVATQGQPPDHVLDAGVKTDRFFQKCSDGSWELKTQNNRQDEDPLMMNLDSLEAIMTVFPVKNEDKPDLVFFVDLLKKMLHLDPAKRISPQEILKHGFVTSLTDVFAGAQTSDKAKTTSTMAPTSGETSKIPHPQCPTTEVQLKPPMRKKRKHEDDEEISPPVSKRATASSPVRTAEDGEKT